MTKKAKNMYLFDEFAEVETERAYDGYFFSVKSAIVIAVCGTFCGLRNMKEIHMWATIEKIRGVSKSASTLSLCRVTRGLRRFWD